MNSDRVKKFRKNGALLVFVLPSFIAVLVFAYFPIYGILTAFQDYVPGDPIISEFTMWIGLKNFKIFFEDFMFWTLIKNTFLLCFLSFIVGFPLPIILALMLNSLRGKRTARVFQTIFYIPHFISMIVMVGMLHLFFGYFGLLNNVFNALGLERYGFFLEAGAFRPLYVLSGLWQDFGWNAIIYLAALSAVQPEEHEAAVIDGASRLQRVIHIDFPTIRNTVSVLLILAIGNLMSVGFEKVLLMQTGANQSASEIIATYVYKKGLTGFTMPGYATAIGLFNSVINVILLIIANTLSRKFSEASLW